MPNPHEGQSWTEWEKENPLSEEDEKQVQQWMDYYYALIAAREAGKISQRQMEKLANVKQPMIARIESGKNVPKISTVMKLLKLLGLTLGIVKVDTKELVSIIGNDKY